MQHANPGAVVADWNGSGKVEWGGEAARAFSKPRREEWGVNRRGWVRDDDEVGRLTSQGARDGDERVTEREGGLENSTGGDGEGEGMYGSGSDLSLASMEELRRLKEGQKMEIRMASGVYGPEEQGQEEQREGGMVSAGRPVRLDGLAEAWWTGFAPAKKRTKREKVKRVFRKMKRFLRRGGI